MGGVANASTTVQVPLPSRRWPERKAAVTPVAERVESAVPTLPDPALVNVPAKWSCCLG